DFASAIDLNIPLQSENPWYEAQVDEETERLSDAVRQFWWSLPRGNQFHFVLSQRIGYDEIIEVDEVGDNVLKVPTVFVSFRDGQPPFNKEAGVALVSGDSFAPHVPFLGEGHVRLFPEEFRDVQWEKKWFSRNAIPYSTEEFKRPPPREPMPIPND